MKKIFLIVVSILMPLLLVAGVYFFFGFYFLSPVEYQEGIIIRNDSHGEGYFAANRRGKRIHEGVDLYAKIGTPVLASRPGIVIAAKQSRGMGKYVILKHFGNITTIYGHLSAIYVTKGRFIRQGVVIGVVGKTGNANNRNIQPHLHFEIRKGGVPQDPLDYL